MKALTLLLIFGVSLPAETDQERGKRIVDQALAALGGDKFLAVEDRIESGRAYSFYRGDLSGLSIATIYTRYLTRPEPPVPGFVGVRERQAFGKKEDNAVVFADGKGYDITFRGARPLDPLLLERFKESTLQNIFYILRQRLGEPGLIFESRGMDVVDNKPVETVEIFDNDGRSITVYFQTSTGLPTQQRYYRRDPQGLGKVEEITLFSKYRDVGGGVMWPLAIQRYRDGEKIFEIFSESVTINQDLRDDLFLLPLDMKILPPIKK
ncbi:MAG: hypothetical protein WD696_00365 [Bryobacteraceae bacterium]